MSDPMETLGTIEPPDDSASDLAAMLSPGYILGILDRAGAGLASAHELRSIGAIGAHDIGDADDIVARVVIGPEGRELQPGDSIVTLGGWL